VQVVADELRVNIDDVRVVLGDTDGTPTGANTAGSRNAIAGGNAALIASAKLRTKTLAIASYVLGVPVEHLDIEDGVVFAIDDRERKKTYGEIAMIANASKICLTEWNLGLMHSDALQRRSDKLSRVKRNCALLRLTLARVG